MLFERHEQSAHTFRIQHCGRDLHGARVLRTSRSVAERRVLQNPSVIMLRIDRMRVFLECGAHVRNSVEIRIYVHQQ